MDRAAVLEGGNEDVVRVTTYRDGKRTEETMPRLKALQLDPQDVDFHWDRVNMIAVVRVAPGQYLTHKGQIPSFGTVKQDLLRKTLDRIGRYLRCYELGQMQPDHLSHWVVECVTGMVYQIRRNLFGENAENAQFLLTVKPLAVAFNGSKSVRIIERVQEPTEDQD